MEKSQGSYPEVGLKQNGYLPCLLCFVCEFEIDVRVLMLNGQLKITVQNSRRRVGVWFRDENLDVIDTYMI